MKSTTTTKFFDVLAAAFGAVVFRGAPLLLASLMLWTAVPCPALAQDAEEASWWKGNLHTHSLWSDGDDFPEVIAQWYKEQGYHFLSFSDHNVLAEGERWIAPAADPHAERSGGEDVFEAYREQFGAGWVEHRRVNDTLEVRLKPLNEFRHLFEEPGRFLLFNSEEITDEKVVHVNATNLVDFIPPQGGEDVADVIQNNVDAVLEQREETGQPMFPHLNHPNFHYAVSVEDLAAVEDLQFFEVYNGHRGVNNYGDEDHLDLDRMWDIALTKRLTESDLGVLYGLAVDDAHNYAHSHAHTAGPGRGWIMVRAAYLTPEHIIAAMEAGDFYATTGVALRDVRFEDDVLTIEIEPESGVDYTTQFIGTRRESTSPSEAARESAAGGQGGASGAARSYSDDIGEVFAEEEGATVSYRMNGDELYVRAKIVSSKAHPNPFEEGDTESAWVQPVQPGE